MQLQPEVTTYERVASAVQKFSILLADLHPRSCMLRKDFSRRVIQHSTVQSVRVNLSAAYGTLQLIAIKGKTRYPREN